MRKLAGIVLTTTLAAGLAGSAHATSLLGQNEDGSIPLQVGGVVVVMPTFEGSKHYRAVGAPFIAPAGLGNGSDGMVQVRGADDVRLRLLRWQGFEAGPLLGLRMGRDDDQRHLHGLGDIDGGLVVGGYAGYRLGPIMPFVSYHHQVTGDDTGGLVRFGVEATAKPLPWLTLTGVVGANWASDAYADAYFSVTQVQSIRSGHAVYNADAGVKDAFLGLTGDIALDDRWNLKLMGRYSRIVGDAADSPIVETERQLFGGVGLTYKFSIGGR